MLLHSYRIFLHKRNEADFNLPFHADKLLEIFSELTKKNEDTIKDFLKCLWTVRFMFDKEVIKWMSKEDEEDDVLQLTKLAELSQRTVVEIVYTREVSTWSGPATWTADA